MSEAINHLGTIYTNVVLVGLSITFFIVMAILTLAEIFGVLHKKLIHRLCLVLIITFVTKISDRVHQYYRIVDAIKGEIAFVDLDEKEQNIILRMIYKGKLKLEIQREDIKSLNTP